MVLARYFHLLGGDSDHPGVRGKYRQLRDLVDELTRGARHGGIDGYFGTKQRDDLSPGPGTVVAPLTACTTRVAADWLFGLGSSTHRRFAAAVGETSGRIDTGDRNRAKASSL